MSRMNMTQMRDQVADELRNISIGTKINRWLEMALTELGSIYVFPSLHGEGTIDTTPGVSYVILNLGGFIEYLWLKTVEIPATQTKLWPEDEQRLSESFPDYKTKQGNITHYYLYGFTPPNPSAFPLTALGLYQVPSSVETITYTYQRTPQIMSSSQVSPLPEAWDLLLIQKAITRGYSYEGNTEAKAMSLAEEARLLKTLGRLVYRRLDETAVMGGPTTRRRPPRPSLPSNFPASRW